MITKKTSHPKDAKEKTWRSMGLALKVDPDILDGILSKELNSLSSSTLQNTGWPTTKIEFVRALIGYERKDLASIIHS